MKEKAIYKPKTIFILCVCTGNICRSPTAEAVFKSKIESKGLSEFFYVDSAGTHGYHIGDLPDLRAIKTAASHGYDLTSLRARQISNSDFEKFDYIFYMDDENERNLVKKSPPNHRNKLFLLGEFANLTPPEIDDPYYGTSEDFQIALKRIEQAVEQAIPKILKMISNTTP